MQMGRLPLLLFVSLAVLYGTAGTHAIATGRRSTSHRRQASLSAKDRQQDTRILRGQERVTYDGVDCSSKQRPKAASGPKKGQATWCRDLGAKTRADCEKWCVAGGRLSSADYSCIWDKATKVGQSSRTSTENISRPQFAGRA